MIRQLWRRVPPPKPLSRRNKLSLWGAGGKSQLQINQKDERYSWRKVAFHGWSPKGLCYWSREPLDRVRQEFLEIKMQVRTIHFVFAMSVYCALNAPISALANPELEACRSTGLIALRERDPSIKDVTLDFDGMTVAKANTKVEDTSIKTIVIGDAYLEKGKKDTRRTFLCLIGEKGKVLLTFFTDQ